MLRAIHRALQFGKGGIEVDSQLIKLIAARTHRDPLRQIAFANQTRLLVQRREPTTQRHQCGRAEQDATDQHKQARNEQIARECCLEARQGRMAADQQPTAPEQTKHLALQCLAFRIGYRKGGFILTRYVCRPRRQIAGQTLSTRVDQQVDRVRINPRCDALIDVRDQRLDPSSVEDTFQT